MFDTVQTERVYQMIKYHDRLNPILSRVIEAELSIDDRAVREAVNELRRQKKPIAAFKGYYVCKTAEEYRQWFRYYRSKCLSMLRTLRFAKWTLIDLDNSEKGQGELLCK